MSRFKLFMMPHAGGNKYTYQYFSRYAPAHFDVIALEYPGRGSKAAQSAQRDIKKLAKQLLEEIKNSTSDEYAIYGHSMGALIAFLMTREISNIGLRLPNFLFLTGCKGPASRQIERVLHDLPKEELYHELRLFGGVTEEILNEVELMAFFEPIIRADFHAVETYTYDEAKPLNVPITVVIGQDEAITLEQVRSWQYESIHPVEVLELPGRHFFNLEHSDKIMKLISEKIKVTSHC